MTHFKAHPQADVAALLSFCCQVTFHCMDVPRSSLQLSVDGHVSPPFDCTNGAAVNICERVLVGMWTFVWYRFSSSAVCPPTRCAVNVKSVTFPCGNRQTLTTWI